MEGTKRNRDSRDRTVSKRMKDEQGNALPVEGISEVVKCSEEQLPTRTEEPTDHLPALKLAHNHCQEACQSLLQQRRFPLTPPPNLSNTLNECDSAYFSALCPSNYVEAYNREMSRNGRLALQCESLEARLRTLEAEYAGFTSSARSHLSEQEQTTTDHINALKLTVNKLDLDISRLLAEQNCYHRLTGLEVTQKEPQTYRCKIKAYQSELIFKIVEKEDHSQEVTLVSYTVPGEKVPQYFKEGLELAPGQEPLMFSQLFSCLF